MASGNGPVKMLGYADDDSPVGTVLVTTMGGGAPAVILAQPTDIQPESEEASNTEEKDRELENNGQIAFDSLFVFGRNSYQLTPAMEENLSRIVRLAKKHQNATILIEGYKPLTETPQHLSLSEKRAKAIADYLVHHKVSNNRIQAKGYAETQPLFSNKSAQGRVKNRRVEVSIIARANNEHQRAKK